MKPLKLSGFRKVNNLINRKCYQGFTLIECLVSLVVLGIIILSFGWFLQIESKLANRPRGLTSSLEWHLFTTNLDNTSQNWRFLKLENGNIWFSEPAGKEGNDIFFIDFVSSQLRKRKNNGVELLLDNVDNVSYSIGEVDIRMDVTFTDGKKYQGIFPQWLKK